MQKFTITIFLGVFALALTSCAKEDKSEKLSQTKGQILIEQPKAKEQAVPSDSKEKNSKFAQVKVGVPEASIKDEHRPVIKKIIEAGKQLDELFLRQVASENPKWREDLAKDASATDVLAYFKKMYGPWDRLDHDRPFWGTAEKPKGVTYYPQDMTTDEFNAWLEKHPEQKEAFTGYFTVIRREGEGLKAVPYSTEYKEFLGPASKALMEAADKATDPRLKKYLTARAEAFSTNEYRQSDMDWMELGDGDIEVVVGPYEVYEDQLFGYKAAFQAIVTLRNPEESKRLGTLKALLPKMEAYLPIDDRYKNPNRGTESPISVVDVLWSGGDIRAGVHTLAFNLPNDEVVREQKGSKKVMLKNIAEAKYKEILLPIAERLMTPEQRKNITFEAFFNHSLVHEMAHGLGPGKLTLERDGKKIETSVNAELKDLYPAIEEAKADILGSYLVYMLIDEGLRKPEFEEQMYASLLGGFFRSMRFGATEAHGLANVIQLNYMMEKGAVTTQDGKWIYHAAKMKDTLRDFAHDILMIEAHGDYAAAKALIDKYGKLPAGLGEQLTGLKDIPTDIDATFTIENQLDGWS